MVVLIYRFTISHTLITQCTPILTHSKNLFYRNDKIFIQLFCFQIIGMIIRLTHLVFLYNPTKLNIVKHFLQIFISLFAITSSTYIWNVRQILRTFVIFTSSNIRNILLQRLNWKIKPGLHLCLYCFWADKLCVILYTRTWVYIPTSNIIISMKQIKREVLVKHFIIQNK